MSVPEVQRTLIVVKPDAVARGHVGEIIGRFEKRGLKLVDVRLRTLRKEDGRLFYDVHKDKPFFGELVDHISSGPVVGVIVEGRDAIALVRRMVGSTRSWESAPGTIRGDLA